jgi:tyrosine-protein phosphatase YwqE
MLAKGFEDISEKVDATRNKLNRAIAKQDRDLMIAHGKELVEQLDVKDMYRTG